MIDTEAVHQDEFGGDLVITVEVLSDKDGQGIYYDVRHLLTFQIPEDVFKESRRVGAEVFRVIATAVDEVYEVDTGEIKSNSAGHTFQIGDRSVSFDVSVCRVDGSREIK